MKNENLKKSNKMSIRAFYRVDLGARGGGRRRGKPLRKGRSMPLNHWSPNGLVGLRPSYAQLTKQSKTQFWKAQASVIAITNALECPSLPVLSKLFFNSLKTIFGIPIKHHFVNVFSMFWELEPHTWGETHRILLFWRLTELEHARRIRLHKISSKSQ